MTFELQIFSAFRHMN